MKTIFYLLLLVPITTFAQLPQPTLTPLEVFHDTTWQWQDSNNTIFTLKILDIDFERNTTLDGKVMFLHYKMATSSGNIIYESRPGLINYNGNLPLGGVLGSSNNPTLNLYGEIDDRTNPNYTYGIPGMLKIVFIPCQGSCCTPQISWKITKPKEIIKDPSSPDDYNLPTDIILTKI